MGVGNAGHRVGQARPGGDQRDAEFAGQFRMRLSHVHGGAFVAHVNNLDALGIEPHPYRHDVAAAEREHTRDATPLQQPRH